MKMSAGDNPQEEQNDEKKQYTIQAKLVSDTGEEVGDPLDLPIDVTTTQLELICNAILKNVSSGVAGSTSGTQRITKKSHFSPPPHFVL